MSRTTRPRYNLAGGHSYKLFLAGASCTSNQIDIYRRHCGFANQLNPRPLVLVVQAMLAIVTSAAWGQSVETALIPGEVIEGHAKYQEECSKCHVKFDKAGQKRVCLDCHKDQAKDVRERKNFHGRME